MADTLRSICEQCPHLSNPRLDFIPDNLAWQKEIISRDLRELVSVAAGDHEKAVVLLAGSVLEALLYSFLKAQEAQIAARRGRFAFDPEQDLQNYLRIFNRWCRNQFPNFELPDLLVHYRNLIHFNQEVESPPGECAKAARALLRAVDALLGEMARFARAGQ
jgi:hypothetical protein